MQYLSVAALALAALLSGCIYDPSGVDHGDAAPLPADAARADAAEPADASGLPDAASDAAADASDDPDGGDVVVDASPADAPGADAPTGPDADVPVTCPTGYERGQGSNVVHCYRYVPQGRSWVQAELDCENDVPPGPGPRPHLVVVDREAEYESIRTVIAGTQLWVGASDRVTEGSFLDVTGGPFTTTHLRPGEPNNGGGGGPGGQGEDCMVLVTDLIVHGFNDANCGSNRPYLCEHDGVPPDPSTY